MTCDYVNQHLFACPRQIENGSIERLFLHLRNFLQRQFRLSTCWRGGFLVAFDELAGEPAKNVIGNAGRVANIGIFREPARFKSLVSKLLRETLQWHSVLERNRREGADGVH